MSIDQPPGSEPKNLSRWVVLLAITIVSWLVMVGVIVLTRFQLQEQAEQEPETTPRLRVSSADKLRAERAGWGEVREPVFGKARDIAFASGALLATDGKAAFYDSGDGVVRPVEVPAAISRVFGASNWLFAGGENDGAPFLIRLAPGEAPMVVPMPCRAIQMAGETDRIVAACEGAEHVAVSNDGGRTFILVPIGLPKPNQRAAADARIDKLIEAAAIDSNGVLALATSQRWLASQGLLWTWGQVALRSSNKGFRFFNVDSLVRTVGLNVSGGATTLAGLEISFDGSAEGELRTRIFHGTEGEPPHQIGEPGPRCGLAQDARSVEGVLLGTQIAAFLCQGHLVFTLDGGTSWRTITDFDPVEMLRGGDMRIVVWGSQKSWERRFVTRSETGATAVRVSSSAPDAGSKVGATLGSSDAGSPGN